MQFTRLAIFGPGLIGGSLALAARRRGVCDQIAIWSRDAAERDAVRKLETADLVTSDASEAVAGADLVILCTPPSALPDLAVQIAPCLPTSAVVTDVASVKGRLVEELTACFQTWSAAGSSRYVGAHPMAGSEASGWSAARANLFEECVCLLTPLDGRTAPEATEIVRRFWSGLGATVRLMSPQAHDEAVALISHLPHVLAAGLAEYVAALPGNALACAGPGWRDMTRLAGGPPEMWTEILSRNRGPVTNALRGLVGKLHEVLAQLEAGREDDLEGFLWAAKQRRDEAASLQKRAGAENSTK